MERYSKFIGAIVGGVVGAGLVAIGVAEAAIPDVAGPITDALLVMIMSSLGTFFSPKNAD